MGVLFSVVGLDEVRSCCGLLYRKYGSSSYQVHGACPGMFVALPGFTYLIVIEADSRLSCAVDEC